MTRTNIMPCNSNYKPNQQSNQKCLYFSLQVWSVSGRAKYSSFQNPYHMFILSELQIKTALTTEHNQFLYEEPLGIF